MKNYIKQFFATVGDLIAHPKKLIPTFVLCGIWFVFSLMSAFGVNIPALRFLYTLTYSNGGMYGGFFGTLGGIFGKAVFAAFINSAVLAITEKQPLFNKSSLRVILKTSTAGGLSAIAPFVTAGGAGLLLYWFFNITASEQNIAVAVAGGLTALAAAGRQKGLLFSLVSGIINKLSKREVINRMLISRALTGLSMGFALGFILTFTRSALVLVIVGIVMAGAGIALGIVGGKGTKSVAAALIAMMIVPTVLTSTCFDAHAASYCNPGEVQGLSDVLDPSHSGAVGSASAVTQYVEAVRVGFGKATSGMLDRHIDQEMYGCPISSESISTNDLSTTDVIKNGGRAELTVNGFTSCYTNGKKGDMIDYSGYLYNISYNCSVELTKMTFTGSKITCTARGAEELVWGLSDADGGYTSGTLSNNLSGDDLKGTWYVDGGHLYVMFSVPGDNGTLTLYLEVERVLPGEDAAAGTSSDSVVWGDTGSDSDSDSYVSEYAYYESDPEYVKWRGRLTYSGDRTNKYGQPFPDLMDFDGDGDMDFADMAIQKELSHNPDYLDMPGSTGAKVLVAILSAVLGGVGGAAGAVLAGAAGGAAGALSSELTEAIASAASEAASGSGNGLGRYISRDSDGDLNVTDPVTGEKRLYKSNGDGTYTNPLTGATYTESELVGSIESRNENRDVLGQDVKTASDAIAAQRADNQGLSDYALQYSADKHASEAALEHELYKERLEIKYGAEGEDLKDAIASRQAQAEAAGEYYQNRADNLDIAVKGLEVTQTVADTGVDVLAGMTGPTGQTIKRIYTVGKNTATRLSEAVCSDDPLKKDYAAALAMAGFDSLADIGQDMAGDAGFQITSNIGSEVFKNGMQNLYDGKDFLEGAGQSAVTGAAKGVVDKIGSVIGDNQSQITKDTLRSDMAFIGHASASGNVSEKGIRALRDMRLMTYVNNVHAEQALSAVTTATGDLSKTVIDGVSDAYSDIKDAMKKD